MQRDLVFSHYRAAAAAALVLSSFLPLIPPRALLNCMRLVASLFLKTSFFLLCRTCPREIAYGSSFQILKLFSSGIFWSCSIRIYMHTVFNNQKRMTSSPAFETGRILVSVWERAGGEEEQRGEHDSSAQARIELLPALNRIRLHSELSFDDFHYNNVFHAAISMQALYEATVKPAVKKV